MTQLEKLYHAINSLKELGVELPKQLIENTNQVEEEIIKNEVFPALSRAISPIINQIQRELVLVVEYIPEEPLQVKMTRKRSFNLTELTSDSSLDDPAEKIKSFTIPPHTKSKKTNLLVEFEDGTRLENQVAAVTFCKVIEKIGAERVAALNITQYGINIVSRKKDDFYNQRQVRGGWYVLTHSSTANKKTLLENIASQLGIKLKVTIP